MLHELSITDFVCTGQFFAGVDKVRPLHLFLLRARIWIDYNALTIFEQQEWLLEVELSALWPPVRYGEIGTTGA